MHQSFRKCTCSLCTLQLQVIGSFYLVHWVVCILLSLSMWLLLRCPALCVGLFSWADSQQFLQHRAGIFSKLCSHRVMEVCTAPKMWNERTQVAGMCPGVPAQLCDIPYLDMMELRRGGGQQGMQRRRS